MNNIQEVTEFNKNFPAPAGFKRTWYECHCGRFSFMDSVTDTPIIDGIIGNCKHEISDMQKLYKLPEDGYECNDKLANLLQSLRLKQRAFFASQPGTEVRATALAESKRLEKELDQFLNERNQVQQPAQPDLFNQ